MSSLKPTLMEKRQFFKRFGQAAMAAPLMPLELTPQVENVNLPYPNHNDEEFWARIRRDYKLTRIMH